MIGAGELERWGILADGPWGGEGSRASGLARFLLAEGQRVAYVAPPVSPWDALAGTRRAGRTARRSESAAGHYPCEGLFVFTPWTWLPVRRWPLFDSNGTWNGNELFSRPRAGDIVREAGFERADVLVVLGFEAAHLIRQFQAGRLVVVLAEDPTKAKTNPRVIRRRAQEIIGDADILAVTEERLLEADGAEDAWKTVVLGGEPDWGRLVGEVKPRIGTDRYGDPWRFP
ncbi:MAG: hypothetical protein RLY93_14675 [Sumerlaeia bacterium]